MYKLSNDRGKLGADSSKFPGDGHNFRWHAFGFMIIDNYSLVNAIYMTIITVSTVGFREAQPLSDGGKLFTALLILMSLGVLTFFITAITQNLFKSQMSFFIGGYNRKTRTKWKNM